MAKKLKNKSLEKLADDGRTSLGKFAKGNNHGNRASNGITRQLKEFIANFTLEKSQELYEIWDLLSAKEKATMWFALAKFALPNADYIAEKNDQPVTITFIPAPDKDKIDPTDEYSV